MIGTSVMKELIFETVALAKYTLYFFTLKGQALENI